MRLSRPLIHALICGGVAIIIGGVFAAEHAGHIRRTLSEWEYRFRDTITATGRPDHADNRLLFLAIDSTSISVSTLDLQTLYSDVPAQTAEHRALELMAAGWPWSREVYALLIERLLNAGARGVVLDLLLLNSSKGDDALQETIRRHPNQVVIGGNFVAETIGPGRQDWSLALPSSSVIPEPDATSPNIGYVNFWPDADGIVRRVYYRATLEQLQAEAVGKTLAALPETDSAPASLAFRGASILDTIVLPDPFAQRLLRYAGPPGTFRPIPVIQLFVPAYWQHNFAAGTGLRDKLVLVGPYGNWAHDEHPTAFGQMAGPELQLNSINALLHRAFIHEWPAWSGYALIAAAAIGAWLLTISLKTIWIRTPAFVGVEIAALLAAKFAYDDANTVVLTIPPVLAFAVAGLASFVYDYAHETLEKLRIRRTLESYVSKDVVREILDNPESYLSALGGRRAQVAIIVTDLRGFTTMAERMESTQLVAQLNEYLELMVEEIFACRGSIDKFIGDAILAVWGHVNSDGAANDTQHAVEAALRMKEALAQLNARWRERGLETFGMGCGLNFGEVVFGNIGSARKMEPTVIGDTVNVTARLEGLTKDYGRDILLGQAAAELVRDSYILQLVDRVVLKGKTKPLQIYTVLGRANGELDQNTKDYLREYEQAQADYVKGEFSLAAERFESCKKFSPEDHLAAIYLSRCRNFITNPPRGDWKGVHVAEHK